MKLFQKITEEHSQIHSMRPPSPWYQNQTKIPHTHTYTNYRPISLINIDAKILNKILANWIHNTLKGSYTTVEWDLSQGCKDFSISENHSMRYTTLTNWKIKTIWSSQLMQKKLLTKSKTHFWWNPQESGHRGNLP